MATKDVRVWEESTPPARSERADTYALVRGSGAATWAFWLSVGALCLGMAGWLAVTIHGHAIPPGGDPGNWVATSYIYSGHSYPSQLLPLAYPPLLFPILGAFVALGGGPIGGVELFVPVLFVALGLSTAWLARSILRTSTVALVVTSFLLVDPALLDMFFWGAYPNLLAFVFMNLALVGLLRASRGHPSSGAFQFWLFLAATVLTHSLAGLVLAVGLGFFLVFALSLELPSVENAVRQAAQATLDAPAVAARALFSSRGGLFGLLLVLLTVGGYYGGTYAFAVPHPAYLTSNAAEFAQIPYGTVFQAFLPHLVLSRAAVFDILVLGVLGALFAFAVVRDRRPRWLTTSAVVLGAWVLAPMALVIAGVLVQIVTDYHRFGFFFLLPLALTGGYLLERLWLLPHRTATPAEDPGPTSAPESARPSTARIRRAPHRVAAVGLVALTLCVVVLVVGTAPAMRTDESAFTKVGHDQAFLEAIDAIRATGVHGGILTVSGAEKWTRALTDENTYAPSSPLYLFYPSQATQAELAYYALTAHYAVTNERVVASIHATNPADVEGLPDYSVYLASVLHPVLRVDPASVRVTLYDPGNRTTVVAGLTGTGVVGLPRGPGQPMTVVYAEPEFTFTVEATVDAVQPQVGVWMQAAATGTYNVLSVSAAVAPAVGTNGFVWNPGGLGSFDWRLLGAYHGPITFANVTPASGLAGLTSYDPITGGAAAELRYDAPSAAGAPSVAGDLALSTPGASNYLPPVGPTLTAPGIWSGLDARFVLMWNSTYAPNPAVAFPGETAYLNREYHIPILYQNSEWSVLELPPPGSSVT